MMASMELMVSMVPKVTKVIVAKLVLKGNAVNADFKVFRALKVSKAIVVTTDVTAQMASMVSMVKTVAMVLMV